MTNLEPRIDTIGEKILVGMRTTMALSDNKTRELWQGFMPRKKEITNTIGTDLYSMQIFDHSYFNNFNPNNTFEKWATIEVSSISDLPTGMERIILRKGLYAVFLYKGTASDAPKTFQYIFQTWLPHSRYNLDNRPHFEILGEKYKNGDPNSEEEIWIPIVQK